MISPGCPDCQYRFDCILFHGELMFRDAFREMIFSKTIPKNTKKFKKKLSRLACASSVRDEEFGGVIVLNTSGKYIDHIKSMHAQHLKGMKNGD